MCIYENMHRQRNMEKGIDTKKQEGKKKEKKEKMTRKRRKRKKKKKIQEKENKGEHKAK